MELVLFYAGSCENHNNKLAEFREALPDKEERDVLKSGRGLLQFIPRKLKVELWAEDSANVLQATELLAKELGVKHKLVQDIGQADLYGLQKMMNHHGGDKCVVLVCGQSKINQWCRQLVSHDLPFDDYSAARFHVDEFGKGELLWFAQQAELARIR